MEYRATERYAEPDRILEVGIFAVKPLREGTVLQLQGSLVDLDEEQEARLRKEEGRSGPPILWAEHSTFPMTVLGPVRFVKHDCPNDCRSNVEYEIIGAQVRLRVTTDIVENEELFVNYNNEYYKNDLSRSCLCSTCEKLSRGGFSPLQSGSSTTPSKTGGKRKRASASDPEAPRYATSASSATSRRAVKIIPRCYPPSPISLTVATPAASTSARATTSASTSTSGQRRTPLSAPRRRSAVPVPGTPSRHAVPCYASASVAQDSRSAVLRTSIRHFLPTPPITPSSKRRRVEHHISPLAAQAKRVDQVKGKAREVTREPAHEEQESSNAVALSARLARESDMGNSRQPSGLDELWREVLVENGPEDDGDDTQDDEAEEKEEMEELEDEDGYELRVPSSIEAENQNACLGSSSFPRRKRAASPSPSLAPKSESPQLEGSEGAI
ncbi:hypothetical protein JCM11641_005777 [Rhodosporidiobolus odoratus]